MFSIVFKIQGNIENRKSSAHQSRQENPGINPTETPIAFFYPGNSTAYIIHFHKYKMEYL